ncbi:MAG: glycosyltransferase family 9 protein [Alistipes sp.]|nr:glycosyltransferase family 9 protein [Candidatus Minthomonas equi]
MVIRFSALGDVAVLAPVLRQKISENPEVDVTLAGPKMLAPLFADIPHFSYIGIDKRSGILKIFRQLMECRPTVVADLHSVIRSFILDFLFILHLIPVHVMSKRRMMRKRLLKNKNVRLEASWQRYDYVLRQAGLKGVVEMPPYIIHSKSSDGVRRVGIAPFSTARGKDYPVEKMETVLEKLSAQPLMEIHLFGGKEHYRFFTEWAEKYSNVFILHSDTFSDELELIKKLDVMVSMDSANLHFASAVGVPAVTVWGATHPFCGFAPWRQNPEWSVQLDLPCRPCSIYGSKPCEKGTYECMESIPPEMIVEKVMMVLNQ